MDPAKYPVKYIENIFVSHVFFHKFGNQTFKQSLWKFLIL